MSCWSTGRVKKQIQGWYERGGMAFSSSPTPFRPDFGFLFLKLLAFPHLLRFGENTTASWANAIRSII